MEGYFRASEYAKLEGINYDTAMQRVSRKIVNYFKEPNTGFVYIYWSDNDQLIPEGYINVDDFAKKHKVSRRLVTQWVYLGKINKEDIFQRMVGRRTQTFIHKDAIVINNCAKNIIELHKPEGYLSLREWYEKNGISKNNASQMILYNKINFIRHFGHIYVPENEPRPQRPLLGFGLSIKKYKPQGYLTINEWCEKYNQKYYATYYACCKNKMPFLKEHHNIYIQDKSKEELLNDYETRVDQCCG